MLDSTQLVSGVAILLSFIAGYRYGVRNLDEQDKTKADESTEKNRVSFVIFFLYDIYTNLYAIIY